MQKLTPYALPPHVLQALVDAARKSDVLIFGEVHGTQEIPRLMLFLLESLARLGYRGLALEIPRNDREALESWAKAQNSVLPDFFARPWADGRGNREVLALIEQVLTSGHDWHLFCFDHSPDQPAQRWAHRDGWMAYNLTEQWQNLCPTAKIVGICGNLHSRLALPSQPDATTSYWPSFARQLQDLHPDKTICTMNVRFQAGTYFNMELHHFGGEWLRQPRQAIFRESEDHSFELLLPRATAVTFLRAPRQ